MSPTPIRPGKPLKPIKPIPGKPHLPVPIMHISRSPVHFRTSILHSQTQKLYEGIDPGGYSVESKDTVEIGIISVTGLSLPPKLKLRYVSFAYTTAGSSYINSVGVSKNTMTGGYSLFYAPNLNLQSTERTEYKTSLFEAFSETDGAITLAIGLMFPTRNERITIGTIVIEAQEVEE